MLAHVHSREHRPRSSPPRPKERRRGKRWRRTCLPMAATHSPDHLALLRSQPQIRGAIVARQHLFSIADDVRLGGARSSDGFPPAIRGTSSSSSSPPTTLTAVGRAVDQRKVAYTYQLSHRDPNASRLSGRVSRRFFLMTAASVAPTARSRPVFSLTTSVSRDSHPFPRSSGVAVWKRESPLPACEAALALPAPIFVGRDGESAGAGRKISKHSQRGV